MAEDNRLHIHVCNNPFLYSYSVEAPEVAIASDDITGFLGLVGVSNPGQAGSATDKGSPVMKAKTLENGVSEIYALDGGATMIEPLHKDTRVNSNACTLKNLQSAKAALAKARHALSAAYQNMNDDGLVPLGCATEQVTLGGTSFASLRLTAHQAECQMIHADQIYNELRETVAKRLRQRAAESKQHR